MSKNIIFFDLDDTLYDRAIPFCSGLKEFGFEATLELADRLFHSCKKRGEEVYHLSQTGGMTMEEMYIYRFQKGFADEGLELSADNALRFQDYYQRMQYCITPSEETVAMLQRCKAKYDRIGVITNGVARHQRSKLAALGMDRWMGPELIFISGEVGILKPDKRIFEMAADRADAHPEELTYVGDSYTHDYIPAKELGWNAILFNIRDSKSYLEI